MDDGRATTDDEGRATKEKGRIRFVFRPSSLVLRLLRRRPKLLRIPVELFDAFQAIAAEEGLTPEELLARGFRKAQKQRLAADRLPGRWETLTPRQQQVISLACQDLSLQEIADRTGISKTTVINHQRRAMRKLNLRTRRQLKQALDQFDFMA